MQSKHQRQAIAVAAARIIAHEGQRNYAAAKRKAAERMGLTSKQHLPSNHEIEQELRSYQNLFMEGHAAHLRMLQETALELMQHFSGLQPRLTGPVLEGTADEYSNITLHLFSDDPDLVVRMLLDAKLSFEASERRIRWHQNDYRNIQVLAIDWHGQGCELCLFRSMDLRQAPPSPINGQPQRRVSMEQLRVLLQ